MEDNGSRRTESKDTIDCFLQELGLLPVLVLHVTQTLDLVAYDKKHSKWVPFSNPVYLTELRGTTRPQSTILIQALLEKRGLRWKLDSSEFYHDRYSFDAQGGDNREALRKLLEDLKNAYS